MYKTRKEKKIVTIAVHPRYTRIGITIAGKISHPNIVSVSASASASPGYQSAIDALMPTINSASLLFLASRPSGIRYISVYVIVCVCVARRTSVCSKNEMSLLSKAAQAQPNAACEPGMQPAADGLAGNCAK